MVTPFLGHTLSWSLADALDGALGMEVYPTKSLLAGALDGALGMEATPVVALAHR